MSVYFFNMYLIVFWGRGNGKKILIIFSLYCQDNSKRLCYFIVLFKNVNHQIHLITSFYYANYKHLFQKNPLKKFFIVSGKIPKGL